MAKVKKDVWSACANCGQNTMHEVLCSDTETNTADYHYEIIRSIVRCKGCLRKSFRYVFIDLESAFPLSEDEWEIPERAEVYPNFIPGHKELAGIHHAPNIVESIYAESLLAIKEKAWILAGLGLRATIEAICNDQKISGKNLEVRIAKLATQGLISQKDAERLHAIRFLGNDAAHEIKKPNENQISVALKIIEHLIQTLYILEREAKAALDTVVSDYDEFREILEKSLDDFNSGDEHPLAKFLGRDVRRIQAAISQMELRLSADISSGAYTRLRLGKVATVPGFPAPLQHFIVA